MTTTLTLTPGDLAKATPKSRDRYVDFLRVASLAVVMLGHWLMAVVVWSDGRLQTSNVLEVTPAARWLTWLFQVMPVFFIVGGFSNSASLAAARRDGVAYGTWLGSRLRRHHQGSGGHHHHVDGEEPEGLGDRAGPQVTGVQAHGDHRPRDRGPHQGEGEDGTDQAA